MDYLACFHVSYFQMLIWRNKLEDFFCLCQFQLEGPSITHCYYKLEEINNIFRILAEKITEKIRRYPKSIFFGNKLNHLSYICVNPANQNKVVIQKGHFWTI